MGSSPIHQSIYLSPLLTCQLIWPCCSFFRWCTLLLDTQKMLSSLDVTVLRISFSFSRPPWSFLYIVMGFEVSGLIQWLPTHIRRELEINMGNSSIWLGIIHKWNWFGFLFLLQITNRLPVQIATIDWSTCDQLWHHHHQNPKTSPWLTSRSLQHKGSFHVLILCTPVNPFYGIQYFVSEGRLIVQRVLCAGLTFESDQYWGPPV